MEIKEIKINNGNQIKIDFDPIPYYLTNPSFSLPPTVPVTVQLGTPIVELPGCVEAHETSNPKNTSITQDDKRGTLHSVMEVCLVIIQSNMNPIR